MVAGVIARLKEGSGVLAGSAPAVEADNCSRKRRRRAFRVVGRHIGILVHVDGGGAAACIRQRSADGKYLQIIDQA